MHTLSDPHAHTRWEKHLVLYGCLCSHQHVDTHLQKRLEVRSHMHVVVLSTARVVELLEVLSDVLSVAPTCVDDGNRRHLGHSSTFSRRVTDGASMRAPSPREVLRWGAVGAGTNRGAPDRASPSAAPAFTAMSPRARTT